MGDFYGKSIIDGVLQYASVSAVKMYDPHTKGGCPRRWGFTKIGGKHEEESQASFKAKQKGLKLDAELKNFLRTGEKNLSPLALKGLHLLELPGPGLCVDLKIHSITHFVNGAQVPTLPEGQRYPEGHTVRIQSQLTAAGVPFVGELDFAHDRGHYRDDEGLYHDDPPDTVEVADIKFKSNAKDRNGNSTLLLPTELYRDIQMAGYGEWVARVRYGTKNVRLSHLNYIEKGGQPTKVTRLHVIDDCRRTWQYVESVVADMKGAARETDVEKIPGNTASCDSFGGCPHREYCTAYRRNSLDIVYGKVATDFVQGAMPVGLLSNNPQILQPQPVAVAAPAQAPAQPQPDMRAQLAAEEQALRQQAAQQQQQMPAQTVAAQLADVCARISSFGIGFPALGGNAALAYAAMGGQSIPPGFVYNGIPAPVGSKRSLHALQLLEPAHLIQLLGELEEERAKQMPQQPPAQPVSFTQQLNAAYTAAVQTVEQQIQQNLAQQPQGPFVQVPQPAAGGLLPPGAPQSMPQLAVQQAAPTNPPVATAAAAVPGSHDPGAAAAGATAPRTRGRPKKDKDGAPEATAAATQAPPPSSPAVAAPQVTPVAQSATNEATCSGSGCILVNSRWEGRNSKSLAGYVNYINDKLAVMYNKTKEGRQGPLDVRAAVDGSILGYGGWKGCVREVVKADPPPEDLYHFDTFMNELNEVVASALLEVAEAKGWMYIRGVR